MRGAAVVPHQRHGTSPKTPETKKAAVARGLFLEPLAPSAQIDCLIQSESRFFGMAPTCIAVGSPFLNRISVGIERTP